MQPFVCMVMLSQLLYNNLFAIHNVDTSIGYILYTTACEVVDYFDAILGFARRVKNYVPSVAFSVVDEALTDDEIEECKKIADSCGVSLRVRKYIGK